MKGGSKDIEVLQTERILWEHGSGCQEPSRSAIVREDWRGKGQKSGAAPGPWGLVKDPKHRATPQRLHTPIKLLKSKFKQVKYWYKGKVYGTASRWLREAPTSPQAASTALLTLALVTCTPVPSSSPGSVSALTRLPESLQVQLWYTSSPCEESLTPVSLNPQEMVLWLESRIHYQRPESNSMSFNHNQKK